MDSARSQRGFEDFHNIPYLWVSEDFEPRRQFDQFLQRFAHAEMVVLSYEGCTVDDPRLQRLAERLTSDTAAASGSSYRSLFPDVSTGYGALRRCRNRRWSCRAPRHCSVCKGFSSDRMAKPVVR